MASQKTVLLLIVLVGVAFAARQGSNLRPKGRGNLNQNQLVGGWTSADQNDGTVQQLAQFAARQICSNYVVDAVEKAETRVVAGKNYRMDIRVSKAWKCTVEVFTQTWTKTQKLTSFACQSVL